MDALMDAPGAVAAHMHHHAGSSWVGRIAAVGLLALLGAGALRLGARRRAPAPAGGDGATVTLSIAGMHCEQCAASVNRALRGCEGVASVSVDARRGQATVTGQGYSTEALRAAVESLGYRVPSR
jgi:copper chaperone CopZ